MYFVLPAQSACVVLATDAEDHGNASVIEIKEQPGQRKETQFATVTSEQSTVHSFELNIQCGRGTLDDIIQGNIPILAGYYNQTMRQIHSPTPTPYGTEINGVQYKCLVLTAPTEPG